MKDGGQRSVAVAETLAGLSESPAGHRFRGHDPIPPAISGSEPQAVCGLHEITHVFLAGFQEGLDDRGLQLDPAPNPFSQTSTHLRHQ